MTSKTEVIVSEVKLNCDYLLGSFLDDSTYDRVIEHDTDFYAPNQSLVEPNGEHNIIFKFRKSVFTKEEQKGTHLGLIGAAGQSQNRGMAAGPKGQKLQNRDWVSDWQIDCLDILMNPVQRLDGQDPLELHIALKDSYDETSTRGLVWLRSKLTKDGSSYDGFFERWLLETLKLDPAERAIRAREFSETCISQTTYAQPVNSGICGFFDRYPRIPYGRACSYNERNPELFEKSFPYVRKLDKCFKALLPQRYAAQKAAADRLDPRFRVGGDTVFTTLTVNKTFRTAAHRDAGDLSVGFSNLGVISTGKDFTGGYLVLPEFRVAVNIRPGDLLLINNHEGIHGNTPIQSVTGTPDDIERMSIVVYFREAMLELGSWEYETARRNYVDSRKTNKEHPLWRPFWNGISGNMFYEQEWYVYLANQPNGETMLRKYHPEASRAEINSLEEWFI